MLYQMNMKLCQGTYNELVSVLRNIVPAHVEMMGLIGMGNNPMVGATVAVAVAIEEAAKAGKF